MVLTQTVNIPASHRLTIDVPREVPEGPAVLTFTPAPAPGPERYRAIEELEGLGKRMGSALTVDRFLEMRHEETEREETEYRHLFRHTDA
jgi:hypothetical protein